MKVSNSVSQTIRISNGTNEKNIFRNVGLLKSMKMKGMSMYSTQYLVGAPLAWITAAIHGVNESVILFRC